MIAYDSSLDQISHVLHVNNPMKLIWLYFTENDGVCKMVFLD
jgi:hypothetical protein